MKYVNSEGKEFRGYLMITENKEQTLPYILIIPEELENGRELVVESLNFEGTNIIEKITPKVIEQLKDMLEVIDDAPILIPFVPDVKGGRPYYQQLSRECFEKVDNDEYEIEYPRIDLQFMNTINDAKEKIQEESQKEIADRIFLNGYSSSGVFAQRFALIHPEIVSRVVIGGAAGSIPLPSKEFEYPLGIRDFKKLFGKDFNEDEYKRIKFAYYVGELETKDEAWEYDINGRRIERNAQGKITNNVAIVPPMHDMSYYPRSIDSKRGREQRKILGEDISERYKASIDYYEENGYSITSKIYRGAEHRGIFSRSNPSFDSLLNDIKMFYKESRPFTRNLTDVREISMKPQRDREETKDREV